MRTYGRFLKGGDLALVLIMALITVGTYWAFGFRPAGAENDLVINAWIAGELVYSEPLEEGDYQVEIWLPRDGQAVLEVEDGSVRVLPMPDHLCPRHICSHVFGQISRPGENIICVPNQLVVELSGSGEADVDAVTY